MRVISKLVRNGNSTQLTLPKPMLRELKWYAGDPVVVSVGEGGVIVLEKLELPKKGAAPDRPVTIDESAEARS